MFLIKTIRCHLSIEITSQIVDVVETIKLMKVYWFTVF